MLLLLLSTPPLLLPLEQQHRLYLKSIYFFDLERRRGRVFFFLFQLSSCGEIVFYFFHIGFLAEKMASLKLRLWESHDGAATAAAAQVILVEKTEELDKCFSCH